MSDKAKRCIARIRELDARATAGPWAVGGPWPNVCVYQDDPLLYDAETNSGDAEAIVALLGETTQPECGMDPDAAFIAAARTELPRVVDALEVAMDALRYATCNSPAIDRAREALERIDRILEGEVGGAAGKDGGR